MTQRSYIMALDSLEGLGPMAIQSLVATYPHARSLLSASNQAIAQLLGQRANRWCGPGRFKQCLKEAEDLLDKQSQQGIQSHCFLDDNYPERLKTLPDLPMMIHVIGSASLDVKHMLAVVGSRKPSPNGLLNTEYWVQSMRAVDPCIVSGLAFGVDVLAHEVAMQQGMITVAVLAHGLHVIHPRSHRDMARRILASGGSLISEHPIGVEPKVGAFPRRNRIIAGLCDATLVVEAAIKSGAGITAEMANQYHRSVFAIPGRPQDVMTQGCLDLIQRHVAEMAVHPQRMLDSLGWSTPSSHAEKKPSNGQHQGVIDALSKGHQRVDDIMNETGLDASKVLAALGELLWSNHVMVRHGRYRLQAAEASGQGTGAERIP